MCEVCSLYQAILNASTDMYAFLTESDANKFLLTLTIIHESRWSASASQ